MAKVIRIKEFEKKWGVRFTMDHTAKMSGVASLSTSPLCNDMCKERAKNPKTICSHCYSMNMQKRYKGLSEKLKKNTEVLTSVIIPVEEMPHLYSETGYFRFEAFGDLINAIQVVNYFNMAKANPHMHCALWTKNPWIIANAINTYEIEKPENLVILVSSYFVNDDMSDYFARKGYSFIDKVFTVYDKKTAAEKEIDINCGGRSCADCGRCYENIGGKVVNELLK